MDFLFCVIFENREIHDLGKMDVVEKEADYFGKEV